MWGEPKLDEHQFGPVRLSRALASQNLNYNNLASAGGSMNITRRKPVARRLPIPLWSQNDADSRRVVLDFCARYVGLRNLSGTDAERLQAVREKAKAILLNKENQLAIVLKQHHELNGEQPKGHRDFAIMVQNFDSQVQVLRRGLVELAMAVAVYSYRLGWQSSKVAEELRLHPPAVREWLFRMNLVANGKKKTLTRYRKPCVPWPADMVWKLFQMRVMGYNFKECEKAFGVSSFTLGHRWRQAFGNLTVKTIRAKALKAKPRAGKWDAERLRAFFALRASGLSFAQCAKRLGTAPAYAARIWRKNFGDLNYVKRAA